MCLVDMEGSQLAGKYKRTSECMTHLAIMKRQPKAKACCHAHPPHGTAFAVAGVQPPTCMIPEAEVFLGQIGLAEYQTPGSPANAEVVGKAAVDHMAVLMVNHGVITWGKDIEDAYWKMENVESYCKTVWVASQLNGGKLLTITGGQAKELIALRKTLGMDDKRAAWKECELCDNAEFQPGTVCQIPGSATAPARLDPDAEKLVQALTDQILAGMK
jgi:L-fuculose-phosphate aldolase